MHCVHHFNEPTCAYRLKIIDSMQISLSVFFVCLICRSLRYGHSIRSHGHNTKNAAPSELPLPQTSTLRSRRRLARLLVAGSFVFVFCWSPYVIFLICTKWSAQDATYSKTAANYSLLLGKYQIAI